MSALLRIEFFYSKTIFDLQQGMHHPGVLHATLLKTEPDPCAVKSGFYFLCFDHDSIQFVDFEVTNPEVDHKFLINSERLVATKLQPRQAEVEAIGGRV